jgi:hypothetical protein
MFENSLHKCLIIRALISCTSLALIVLELTCLYSTYDVLNDTLQTCLCFQEVEDVSYHRKCIPKT